MSVTISFLRPLGAFLAVSTALFVGTATAESAHRAEVCVGFSSEPVTRIGEIVVTQHDLDARMLEIPESDRTHFVSSRQRVAESVESLARRRGVFADAIESGLLDDEILNARLYGKIVDAVSAEQTRHYIESRLLDDYSERAREIYLASPDLFRTSRQYDFTHVLIQTSGRGEAEAMRRVLDLHDRYSGGESFETLVIEYSEDPTVDDNQGGYENMPLDQLDRNFANALRQLDEPGAVSGPVRTRFGWHLIRLDGVVEPQTPSWEEVADQARELARQRHRERLRERYFSDILTSGPVEITPGAIEAFQRRHGFDPDRMRATEED